MILTGLRRHHYLMAIWPTGMWRKWRQWKPCFTIAATSRGRVFPPGRIPIVLLIFHTCFTPTHCSMPTWAAGVRKVPPRCDRCSTKPFRSKEGLPIGRWIESRTLVKCELLLLFCCCGWRFISKVQFFWRHIIFFAHHSGLRRQSTLQGIRCCQAGMYHLHCTWTPWYVFICWWLQHLVCTIQFEKEKIPFNDACSLIGLFLAAPVWSQWSESRLVRLGTARAGIRGCYEYLCRYKLPDYSGSDSRPSWQQLVFQLCCINKLIFVTTRYNLLHVLDSFKPGWSASRARGPLGFWHG